MFIPVVVQIRYLLKGRVQKKLSIIAVVIGYQSITPKVTQSVLVIHPGIRFTWASLTKVDYIGWGHDWKLLLHSRHKKSLLKDWVTVWLWVRVVKKLFKNRSSHSGGCEFVLFVCLTGMRFACGSPPCQTVTVKERQQLSRRTLSATLLACLFVCVCVGEREGDSGGAETRAVSPGTLLWRAHCRPLSPPLASFQNPFPSALVLFHPCLSPCGFLSPRLSGQRLCRDLPANTAREGESRGKKRKRETDQSITLILKKDALEEKRRGSSSIFLYTFLLQRIFWDSY